MRTFWLLALAAAVFLQGNLSAQEISGTVRDARTGAPLQSANVMLDPGGRGMATDAGGNFSFANLPKGKYTIRASYVGYKTEEQSVAVGEGRTRITFDLLPSTLPGPAIEISASRARERFSPVTFSNVGRDALEKEYFVQDVPVLLADQPSVTFYSEGGSGVGYNYLRIRGFDQRRLADMVNGIPQNDPEDHNV